MPHRRQHSYFHLHMISDATGETLHTVARAATARYTALRSIEHTYPLIRSRKQLDKVIAEIEKAPGIVLYTMVDPDLSEYLEGHCAELGAPCVSILEPVLMIFQSYLGAEQTPRIGAQHVLDAAYFRRIDALNYTLMHDDGQMPEGWNEADVILLGISRTSKTPTSIYLANRGLKTANVPLVPGIAPSAHLFKAKDPLIVGLIASAERIRQVRENRLLALAGDEETPYTNRISIAEEIASSKRFFAENGWPTIDVSRRSIEETAAAVIALHQEQVQQTLE